MSTVTRSLLVLSVAFIAAACALALAGWTGESIIGLLTGLAGLLVTLGRVAGPVDGADEPNGR